MALSSLSNFGIWNVYAGDGLTKRFTFMSGGVIVNGVLSGGTPVPLTGGYELSFMAKKRIVDPDSQAAITKDLDIDPDPASGIATLSLTRDDTKGLDAVKMYIAEIRIVAPNGEPERIQGNLVVVTAVQKTET